MHAHHGGGQRQANRLVVQPSLCIFTGTLRKSVLRFGRRSPARGQSSQDRSRRERAAEERFARQRRINEAGDSVPGSTTADRDSSNRNTFVVLNVVQIQ